MRRFGKSRKSRSRKGSAVVPFSGPTPRATFRSNPAIAAAGAPEGSTVADTAEGLESYTLEKAAQLARLVISDHDALAAVSSIKINNEELVSGFLPPAMFAPDCPWSPTFGHVVSPQDSLKVGRTNQTGGNDTYNSGFLVKPYTGQKSSEKGVVGVGGPDDTTCTANTTTTLTFTITEPAHLKKLIMQFVGTYDIDDLLVTSISYDNFEYLTGNVPASVFAYNSWATPDFGELGLYVEPGHSLTITIENQHATEAAKVWAGFTV